MSRLWQTVLSIWAWVVLVTCVMVWFPLMAVLRLVTAPFDRGRTPWATCSARSPVVVAASTRSGGSAGRRHLAGRPSAPVRRGVEPRVLRRHPADQPPALGDEVAVQGRAVPRPGARLDDAARGRHPGRARVRPRAPSRRSPAAARRWEAGVGHDLPRRHPVGHRRDAAVQRWRLPPRDRRRCAHPPARGPRDGHALRNTAGDSAARPPWCRCLRRSRRRA